MLYVKAVYDIRPGKTLTSEVSFYSDTLVIDGFGDTRDHEVNIYSVGKNGKESAPISLKVTPLEPPVKAVFKSVSLGATFGGVLAIFKENTFRSALALTIIEDTTGMGTWNTLMTYYTYSEEGNFSYRGLNTVKRRFGIYVRDHWNNVSDTLMVDVLPIFEEEIPKNKWKLVKLPSDTWESAIPATAIEYAWDNKEHTPISAARFYKSVYIDKFPVWFTIDLGEKVKLSRIRLFQRGGAYYLAEWTKEFEIWGTDHIGGNGDWDDWQLLGHFESRKPSGLPGFDYTTEDKEYQDKGEDFDLIQPAPTIRYIRFKTISNYGGGAGQYDIDEIYFWGQVIN